MGVVVCEAYRDEGVAPTRGMSEFCGSPAPGAMGGGLRGLSRRGRRSYKANRDEGVAPTKQNKQAKQLIGIWPGSDPI